MFYCIFLNKLTDKGFFSLVTTHDRRRRDLSEQDPENGEFVSEEISKYEWLGTTSNYGNPEFL